ncbi:MAG: TonB-dependent receptor, partial [Bacteroidia bacterium]|nr:TonB-dependent receptor [Bacteroidia bacterium]
LGLSASSFSFGDIGGAQLFDTRASVQRKQIQVSYALADRVYDNRVMASLGTGISKKGWSGAFSFSHRWSDEGYIPGTFYDGTSYFISAEKIFGAHSLSLTAFGAPTKTGRAKAVIEEMYDLAGTHFYNPNWGYQNGKKRNAAIRDNHIPVFILSHEWNINEKSSLTSSASYRLGKTKYSGLTWYNAPDPRPDYYRNLPSFVDATDSLQNVAQNLFSTDESQLQLKWDKLYEVNENNIESVSNVNGISGNNVTGKRSLYILHDRVTDNSVFSLNTLYNETVSENLSLDGGLMIQSESSESYNEVNDLLGGDFYVDLNKYADTSTVNAGNVNAVQNDLNNPNRILHKGDQFGYDYTAHVSKTSAWMQTQFKYSHFDFFFASNVSATSFYRTGHYRNGLFPDESYGDSETQNFFGGGFKSGITYKLNGRNYFYATGAYVSRAPKFEDIFYSANTRNSITDNLKNETIQSAEGGYILRSPKIKGRVTGYVTQFNQGVETQHWLLEGSNTSFVNFTMTGIDRRHTGIEISADVNLGFGLSAAAAASVGQYIFNSRPRVTATADNFDTTLIKNESLYIENLRVAGSPQSAYSFGLNYRSKNFWFLNATVNYFDNMYVNYGPARRTLSALDAIDKDSPLWNELLSQRKFDAQVTMDVSAGWSWKMNNKFKSLKKNTFILFNLGVSNVTDNKNIVIGGYEQPRISPQGMYTDVNRFPEKISYAFGRTFFASVILRMN